MKKDQTSERITKTSKAKQIKTSTPKNSEQNNKPTPNENKKTIQKTNTHKMRKKIITGKLNKHQNKDKDERTNIEKA